MTEINHSNLNIVFLGTFPYPHGMAGTKRVQHAIDGIRSCAPDALIRVLVLRQSGDTHCLNGIHKGTQYETVGANLFRTRAVLMAPFLTAKGKRILQRWFCPSMANILYVYGPPSLDNRSLTRYARTLGFKIIFDIVEDDDVAFNLSKSPWHRLNNLYTRHATENISERADGIIVISSWLQKKFTRLTKGKIPMHLRPISVDMDRFFPDRSDFNKKITLLYSGSFGPKDGVTILIDAFDELATHNKKIELMLTGRGSTENMHPVFSRINHSPHKERIIYQGYLDDEAYYATLNSVDIPCMTRVDTPYAHAGFPFKLGEFLATGKPVIASKVSDVENILKDRKNAMLVAPGDSGQLATAIEFLVKNPAQAEIIGKNGKNTAIKFFNYRHQGKLLYEYIKKLLL